MTAFGLAQALADADARRRLVGGDEPLIPERPTPLLPEPGIDPAAAPEGFGTVLRDNLPPPLPAPGQTPVLDEVPPAARMADDFVGRSAALSQLSNLLRANQEDRAQLMTDMSEAQAAAMQQYEQAREETQEEKDLLGAEMARLQADYEDLSKVSARDLEKRAMGESTGGQIMSRIALALGTFASILTKTPNVAMQLMKARIDREFKAHAAKKNGMLRLLGMKRSEYDRAVKELGGEMEAIKFFRDSAVNDAASKIRIMAAEEGTAMQKANMELAADRLEAEVNLSRARQLERVAAQRKAKQLSATEVKDIAGLKTALDAVDRLHEKHKNLGWHAWLTKSFPATEASRFVTDAESAAQVVGELVQTGVLTDADFERFKSFLPTARDTDATAARKRQNIDQLLGQRAINLIAAAKAAGRDTSRIEGMFGALRSRLRGEAVTGERVVGATSGGAR